MPLIVFSKASVGFIHCTLEIAEQKMILRLLIVCIFDGVITAALEAKFNDYCVSG